MTSSKQKSTICLYCGHSMQDKCGTKYCSNECRHLSTRKRVDCKCKQCGKSFQVTQSDIKNGVGKYCSNYCKGIAQLRTVESVCLFCGNKFYRPKGVLKISRGMYCSHECSGKALTTQVEKICICGKHFFVKQSHAKRRKCCSKECQNKQQVGVYAGDKNPAWRGGTDHYRGANWYQQRKLAYERDGGICQYCHRKPKPNERKCAVHHIKPFREFNGEYLLANDLLNLITLCVHCHPKAEHGLIPVPKRLL